MSVFLGEGGGVKWVGERREGGDYTSGWEEPVCLEVEEVGVGGVLEVGFGALE